MLQSEIYKKVAADLNVPLERVMEYDKKMWNFIKISLNNPTFDTLEIPFFGSFNITKVRMHRTAKQQIIILKKMRDKLKKHPNNEKLKNDFEIQKELFKKLWKLKQQCKL